MIILIIILLIIYAFSDEPLQETNWHESDLFVSGDNSLIDFKDMTVIDLNEKTTVK